MTTALRFFLAGALLGLGLGLAWAAVLVAMSGRERSYYG